jgi:hypothetical protein
MAKLNEGDVIEGIFAIALSLYLAYGKIDKKKLNEIRTKIDTKMFSTGRFKYMVASNHKRQIGKNLPDFLNVSFEMRLKPESVQGAFGKDYNVLYKSSKDLGNIDKKIDQLIKAVENSSFSRKADLAIDTFLKNKSSEIITIIVVADGIAGESSGGQLKGDIMLEIYATKKGANKKIAGGTIPFSLKSESVTVANLSPYRGMLDIAKAINVKWDAEEKYSRLSQPFKGPVEQAAKFKLIENMYKDLKTNIIKESSKSSFTKNSLNFLRKSIFGSDLADVIDIQRGGVKEITVEYFNKLEKSIKLIAEIRGNNLIFMDRETKNVIFQIRTKLRKDANEAKFYLEVGKGAYSK